MSNNNLAGFPAFGPRVDTAITYNPSEVTLETPESLPTSEPETAQVQVTITAGHLPVFTPYQIPWADNSFSSAHYSSSIIAIVRNLSGSTRTIYAKHKTDNTPTWSTATTLASLNNRYIGITLPGLTSWSIGDQQEMKIHASNTGCVLLSYGLIIYPTLIGSGISGGIFDLNVGTDNANLFAAWASVTSSTFYATLYNDLGTLQLGTGVIETQKKAMLLNTTSGILTVAAPANIQQATEATAQISVYPTRIAYTPIL